MPGRRIGLSALVTAVLAGTAAGCVPEAPPMEAPAVTTTPPTTASLIDLKPFLIPIPSGSISSSPEHGDSRDIAEIIAPAEEQDSTADYLDRQGFVRGAHEWWLDNGVDHYVVLLKFGEEVNAERYLRHLSRSIGPVPGSIDGIPGSRAFQDEDGTFFGAFFRRGTIVADVRVFTRAPSSFDDAMQDLPERQYDLLPEQ